MIPGSAGKRRRNAPPGLVIVSAAGGLRLVDERGRKSKEVENAVTGEAVWDTLSKLARGKPAVPLTLRLANTDCFIRRVELPETLGSDARRFLDLDLERATPFRLKDVYSDHYITGGRARNGKLTVHHVVVRRERVDKLVSEIEGLGLKLAAIDCLSEDGASALPINFLAAQVDAANVSTQGRTSRTLLALAGILAVSAAYISISRHEEALSELKAATQAARTKLQSVQQAVQAEQEAERDFNTLATLKSESVSALQVLDSVTRLVPDSAWLTDLRIDAGVIEISGQSESAAPLISAFENSGAFEGAAFTAPVTRDADGKERFAIKMRIKGRRVVSAPSGEGPAPR
jgi:general secretion pathway protein L